MQGWLHCEESAWRCQFQTHIRSSVVMLTYSQCHVTWRRDPCTVVDPVQSLIASSYNEPPLESARLLEYEYDRCYPTMSYHDLRYQKWQIVDCQSALFVGGRIRDMLMSELVTNDGSAINRRILLLFFEDGPWYTNEVGTDFHLPNVKIRPSLPPAARRAVGAAILMQCGLNHAGLKPKSPAHWVIACCTCV